MSGKFSKILLLILAILFVLILIPGCTENGGESRTVPVLEDPDPDGELQFTVSFNSNGGSTVPSQKISASSLVIEPTEPTKENYVFLGWYADSYFTKKWDFRSDVPTSSMTLYASWKLFDEIVFLSEGITFDKSTSTISYVLDSSTDTLSLTDKILLDDSNTFYSIYRSLDDPEPISRSNECDLTDLDFGENKFYLVVFTAGQARVKVYTVSVYRKHVYTVDFYGLDNVPVSSLTVEEGKNIAFPAYNPAGYDVKYWTSGSEKYVPTGTVTIKSNKTFYVTCDWAVYNVRLNAQGGTISSETAGITFASGYVLPVPHFEGHYFNGWTTSDGVRLTGANGASFAAWYYSDVTELYADWTTSSFEVTYRIDYLEEEQTVTSVDFGSEIKFSVTKEPRPAGTPDSVMYIFCGWSVNGSVVSMSMDYTLENIQSTTTVRQIWKKIDVKNYIFDQNGIVSSNDSAFSYSIKNRSRSTDASVAGKPISSTESIIKRGDRIEFTAVCSNYSHTFLFWASNKEDADNDLRLSSASTFVLSLTEDIITKNQNLSCVWVEYKVRTVLDYLFTYDTAVDAAKLNVEYLDRNTFGVLLKENDATVDMSMITTTDISDPILSLFDELTNIYAKFISAFDISDSLEKKWDMSDEKDAIFCSDLQSSIVNTNFTVNYCDCNALTAFNGISKTTINTIDYLSQETIESFDLFASLYAAFIGNHTISIDSTKIYAVTEDVDDVALLNKARSIYDSSNYSFTNSNVIDYTNSQEALIGLNRPFLITFNDVTYDNNDYETFVSLLAKSFGFSDKNDFLNAVENFVSKYVYLARFSYNGAVCADNGYCIFPFALTNDMINVPKTVLTYLIIDPTGVASIWCSDLSDLSEITTDGTKLKIYGRCVLFDTPQIGEVAFERVKDVYVSAKPSYIRNELYQISSGAIIGLNKPFVIEFASDSKTYSEYITVISRLFGFDSSSDFLLCAQYVADLLTTNSLDASCKNITHRLMYDGAIYTENGCFVLPYSFICDRVEGVVLGYIFVDASGSISVWLSDVSRAFTMANYNNILNLTDTYAQICVLGRYSLYDTELLDWKYSIDITANENNSVSFRNNEGIFGVKEGYQASISTEPDVSDAIVFTGWYDESGTQLSDKLNYSFRMDNADRLVYPKWIRNPLSFVYTWDTGAYTSILNDSKVQVEYLTTSGMSEVLNKEGATSSLASLSVSKISEEVAKQFDGVAESFVSFLSNYNISLTTVSANQITSNDRAGAYAALYSGAKELFNSANNPVSRFILGDLIDSSVVGISSEYLFDEYYVIETDPTAVQLSGKVLYEYDSAARAYKLSEDTVVDTEKVYYRLITYYHYSAVSNPSVSELVAGIYYEYDGAEYVISGDTVLDTTKTYYTRRTYSEIIDAIATVFGYETSAMFIAYAKSIAAVYNQNTIGCNTVTIGNRLGYTGAVYTENGSFVLPVAFGNDYFNTLLTLIIVDADGHFYIWISDVDTLFAAANVEKIVYNKEYLKLTAYDRTDLFDFDRVPASFDVQYEELRCGAGFTINVVPELNEYYENALSIKTSSGRYETAQLDYDVIPTTEKEILINIIDNPFRITTNLPGAGRVDYEIKRIENVNGSYQTASYSVGCCSDFGKSGKFPIGLSNNDIVELTAETFTNYIWLGWYYSVLDGTDNPFKLYDTSKNIDVKKSDSHIEYRATWKSIDDDLRVLIENKSADVLNAVPGNVNYYCISDDLGRQMLCLSTTIEPGFFFEGWYADTYEFDVDSSISTVVQGNKVISYQTECLLNISELAGYYDLSTIKAVYSALPVNKVYFAGESKYTSSVDNICDASIIGYYQATTSGARTTLNRIHKVVVDLLQTGLEENVSSGAWSINAFICVTLNRLDINYADISALGYDGVSRPSYISKSNTVEYVINMDDLRADLELVLHTVDSLNNTTTVIPNSIRYGTLDETVPGQDMGTIKVSAFDSYIILHPVAKYGYAFLYWRIENLDYSGNDEAMKFTYQTIPDVYLNNLGRKNYTAFWTPINDGTSKIYVEKNIDEAGDVSFTGNVTELDRNNNATRMELVFTAKTNSGYYFKGWYDGNTLISNKASFSVVCSNLTDYFNGRKQITYSAKWAEIDARPYLKDVFTYDMYGYVAYDGAQYDVYYDIYPHSDLNFTHEKFNSTTTGYDEIEAGNYKDGFFLGWYTEDGQLYSSEYILHGIKESDIPTKLYTKWNYTPKEYLSESEIRSLQSGSGSSFDISKLSIIIEKDGEGKTGYLIYEDREEIYIQFYAEPAQGYYFSGWYNDQAMSATDFVSYNDTNQNYFATQINSEKMRKCILDGNTFSYTIYAKFNSPTDYPFTINMSRSTISGTIANEMIAEPYFTGYQTNASQIRYMLHSGLKSGYVFVKWNVTETRLDGSDTHEYYGETVTFDGAPTTSYEVTAEYMKIGSIWNEIVTNPSPLAGSVEFFCVTEQNGTDLSYPMYFMFKPKKGYCFYKITSIKTVGDIQVVEDHYLTQGNFDTERMCYVMVLDPQLDSTAKTNYRYIVYWQSIWQNGTKYFELGQYIDHVSTEVYGYIDKEIFADNTSKYETTYALSTDCDMDDYDLIGWYSYDYEEDLFAKATNKQYLSQGHAYNCTVTDLTQPVRYSTDWGKYKVILESNSKEQFLTPDGFEANITYVIQDQRMRSESYISDIAFVYADVLDEELDRAIQRKGYEYSGIDLNAGEGGKRIYLVWKKTPTTSELTYFVTAVSLVNSNLSNVAKELFTEETADLNYGTGGAPIHCYFSYDSSLGKPLVEIGVLKNDVNNDFYGNYQFVDLDNKTNLTPYSSNDTYLIYRRSETPITITYDPVLPDTVSVTNALFYQDFYTQIENVPAGLIFAGWYDNPFYTGKPFDFSKTVYADVTLYAKWYTLSDYETSSPFVLSPDATINAYQNEGDFFFTALSNGAYGILFSFDTANATQTYSIYDTNTGKYVSEGRIAGTKAQLVPFSVTAGHLYKLVVHSIGVKQKMYLKLASSSSENFDYPAGGGKFRSLIPYKSDFSIEADCFDNQTFLGWYDLSGNEVSDTLIIKRNVGESDSETIFTLHKKTYSIPYYNVNGDIKLYGHFKTYSVQIINPEPEAYREQRYDGVLEVGEKITLTAINNTGFSFKQWKLFDPDTGDVIDFTDDIRFTNDLLNESIEYYISTPNGGDPVLISHDRIEEDLEAENKYYIRHPKTNEILLSFSVDLTHSTSQSSVYSFHMFGQNLIFVLESMTNQDVEDSTYDRYVINYVDAGVNPPENRKTFYYKKSDGGLETEVFSLQTPEKTEVRGGYTGYYIFKGWYYQNLGGEYVSLYNADSGQYFVTGPDVERYAIGNTVSIYALWEPSPITGLDVLIDDDGMEYFYLGEYPQTRVVRDSAEYRGIDPNSLSNGYYLGNYGETKYVMGDSGDYYRVEPLRWDILRKGDDAYTVQLHFLIDTISFNFTSNSINERYPNSWDYSSIRQYLNSEFFTTVFNEYERNLIELNPVINENGASQGSPALTDAVNYPWVEQSNTTDYVYLFAYAEATNILYGFSSSPSAEDNNRKASGTDYYHDKVTSFNPDDEGIYWLRSPGNVDNKVYVVDKDGKIATKENVTYVNYGYRLTMKVKYGVIPQKKKTTTDKFYLSVLTEDENFSVYVEEDNGTVVLIQQ